jgi:murein DD-endopeptidase MepM/ murein hydrolase activator NlpD
LPLDETESAPAKPKHHKLLPRLATAFLLTTVAVGGVGVVTYLTATPISPATAAANSSASVVDGEVLAKSVGTVENETDSSGIEYVIDEREAALIKNADKIDAFAEKVKNDNRFYWPTESHGSIGNNGFGPRVHPITGKLTQHNGTDLPGARCGQPIYAIQKGTVTKASIGNNGGSGNTIVIDHGDILGKQFRSQYMHMDKLEVKVGQEVQRGQRIGTVGTTGLSTGCHLHLSMWVNGSLVDPMDYVSIDTWDETLNS